MSNELKERVRFTEWQLLFGGFIGTSIAMACLVGMNVANSYSRKFGAFVFGFFLFLHVAILASNLVSTRAVSTIMFLIEVVALLLVNHILSNGDGGDTRKRSWGITAMISIGFLVAWLFLILVVLG